MNPRISRETSELLIRLTASSSRLRRLFGHDDRCVLLAQIGATEEVAAIPAVVGYLFATATVSAAAGAIADLLGSATPEDLVWLDQEVRRSFASGYRADVQPKDVHRLLAGLSTDSQKVAMLGMLSFYYNGFVREEAIRGLAEIATSSSIPFLLIRLNDWVPAVREASAAAINKLLAADDGKALLDNPFLVIRLTGCRRVDHSPIIDKAWRLLVDPANKPRLFDVLRDKSPLVRRMCYTAGMTLSGDHPPWVIHSALRSPDVVLRAWAARDSRRVLNDADLLATLSLLASDHFMPVRREGLMIVLERYPENAESELERALMDRNRSMRQLARFWLERRGRPDFAEYYRAQLVQGQFRSIAIAGLGETGSKNDTFLIEPYLSSHDNAVRRSAVRAVGNLWPEKFAETLCRSLRDSASICAEARIALRNTASLVALSDLWEILATSTQAYSRIATLDLISHHPFWDSLPYLLSAASDLDQTIAHTAEGRIRSRMVRLFTRPTTEQMKLIRTSLDACAAVRPALVNDCRAWLGALR